MHLKALGVPASCAPALPLAALLLFLLLGPGAASAHQAGARASTVVGSPAERAREFWTPARMRRAKPLRALLPAGIRHPGHAVTQAPTASPEPPLTPPVETIPDPTIPGVRQNGAVFVVGPFGTLGRCSGTSITAPNGSLVITAGHCVHDFGGWQSRRWVFVPAYRFGERPFGTFVARWLGTTPQWLASENPNFDIGAAVVSRNERGQLLADAVGAYRIAWNLPHRQAFDVYGYPVEKPFDGATMQRCSQTPFEGHALFSFLAPGPLDLAVQCGVTAGASGGGWLIGGDTLNGVTAEGYPGDSTNYGPYFGSEVGRLYSKAARVR